MKYEIDMIKAALSRAEVDKAVSLTIKLILHDKLEVSYTDTQDRQVSITIPPVDSGLFGEILIRDRFYGNPKK